MEHAYEGMVIRNHIAMLEYELKVLEMRIEYVITDKMEQTISRQISEKQELIVSELSFRLRSSYKPFNRGYGVISHHSKKPFQETRQQELNQ